MEESEKRKDNLGQPLGPDRPPDNVDKKIGAGQSNEVVAPFAKNNPSSSSAGESKKEGELKSVTNSSHKGQSARLQYAKLVDQEDGAAQLDQVHVQASAAAPSPAELRDSAPLQGKSPIAAAPHAHGGPEINPSAHQETSDVTDEDLWCTAIVEKSCKVLKELLSKIPSHFWNYENNLNGETVLHIAVIQGDLTLAEKVLNRLSRTEEVVYGSDGRLFHEGGYVAAKTASGKTAQVMARENGHVDIENKIIDYVDNMKKISAAGGSLSNFSQPENLATPEQSRLNDAIKKRDCQALLNLLRHEAQGNRKYRSKLLEADLQKVVLKHGKEEGRTVLHIAAMQGCFSLAKLVLDQLRAEKLKGEYGRLLDYI